jgi:hypothetical protein
MRKVAAATAWADPRTQVDSMNPRVSPSIFDLPPIISERGPCPKAISYQ